ncbi:zinc-dependent alcohol dehydrogenase family protein [Luoshenia tenuis]|jgi:threonine dehydrogenase-like Zn-dependent dehydrogenase|uniref:zinc-dependent alcohol dehydrogenase family protein n=1 Tax=Luoshenia tenuis TaxID=2763654 RepID=UPI003D9342C9
MKSAVFYGKHDVRIEEAPQPKVGADDVLIRIAACGVCGTDVHIFEGDKGAADVTPPTILGHEFSGIVEAVGDNVKDIAVGDKVCVDPNDTCGECYYCRNGIAHFCEHMTGIGTTTDGGFAQYCSVHKKQVYKLLPEASLIACAMAEPVACCLHGFDMCDVQPGSVVMVIGGGMIGLIMVQLAKIAGAHKVILLEPVAVKREMGAKLGADLTIDPLNEDVKAVLAAHHVGRINTVIECAGLKSTIAQAIDLAGKQSTVMMFGLTKPDDEVPIKPFEIFQKEVVLKASYINPYTQTRAVNLIQSGKIDVTSMVAEVCSLEKLKEVLADPALRAKGKYIVDPWMA